MKRTISAMTAAAALSAAMPAGAATLDYLGPTTAPDRPRVVLNETPVAPSGVAPNPQGDFIVGAFGHEMRDVDTLREFVAFCIDLTERLVGRAEYQNPSNPLDAVAQSRVQAYYDANFLGVDVSDRVQAAAFQMGLWETIYDDDSDLLTGAFQAQAAAVEPDAADIDAQAQSYLDNVANGPTALYTLSFFTATPDDDSQDLVEANPGAGVIPIPVPAGGVLLVSALAAMGVARRRRG